MVCLYCTKIRWVQREMVNSHRDYELLNINMNMNVTAQLGVPLNLKCLILCYVRKWSKWSWFSVIFATAWHMAGIDHFRKNKCLLTLLMNNRAGNRNIHNEKWEWEQTLWPEWFNLWELNWEKTQIFSILGEKTLTRTIRKSRGIDYSSENLIFISFWTRITTVFMPLLLVGKETSSVWHGLPPAPGYLTEHKSYIHTPRA